MKLFVIVALFCAVAGVKAGPSCEVAAFCEYEDGTMKNEFKILPSLKAKSTEELNCCDDAGWWDGPDNRQYQVAQGMAPWGGAEAKCEEIGGHVIQHGAKHQSAYDKIVADYLKVYHGGLYGFWLALSKQDGEFVWSNGDPMTEEQKENWSYPYYDGSGDCAYIARDFDDYGWDDAPCGGDSYILCERKKDTECQRCPE